MDVCEFAMKMEEDGRAYYRNLAIQSALPGLKTIFSELAEDEQKHYDVFRQLKTGAGVPAMAESTALDTARNVFEALPRGTIALKGIADCAAAYDHAMQLEAESFAFYERAASEEKNQETRKLLIRIAIEERKHYDILENIFNFVNAPHQSLEWEEFSNLGEFRQFGRDTDS
jgi:rubrerythrin